MQSAPDSGTDIEALAKYLGPAASDYYDAQALDAGLAAVKRWPLLARLRLGKGFTPAQDVMAGSQP